ncbi:MAG: hypothetical protein ACXWUG_15595 [Polyangiales bacterium]
MKRALAMLILMSCLVSCTEPRAPTPAIEPTTDANVCARYCARMASCEIAPQDCEKGCALDKKKFRDGFFVSVAGCLDHELSDSACAQKSLGERRQTISLCFSATLEAWSKKDDGTSLRTIVSSVCAREARCHPGEKTVETDCSKNLEAKMRAQVSSAIYAAARPELVHDVAECVRAASCSVEAPADACFENAMQR